MKNKNILKEETYLNKIISWQDKMNLPGEFLGADIHPSIMSGTKASGFWFLTSGIFVFLSLLTPTIYIIYKENITTFSKLKNYFFLEGNIVQLILALIATCLYIFVGIKIIQRFNKIPEVKN